MTDNNSINNPSSIVWDAVVPVPTTPPPAPLRSRNNNSNDGNNKNSIVKLDVGGTTFTTSLTTLTRTIPGSSYFESMLNFSGRHNNNSNNSSSSSSIVSTTSTNSYFIDRDGKHFRHILNYLRCGTVVTLPPDDIDKEELAIEADFYGLDGLVRAIHRPPLDVNEYLSDDIIAYQEEERKFRAKFVNGDYTVTASSNNSPPPPYLGLISLFSSPSNKYDDGYDGDVSSFPLRYNPANALRRDSSSLFLSEIKKNNKNDNQEKTVTVTVSTLEKFTANFNKEHPNILHRIGDILRTENVIIAGGAVLSALSVNKKIRTGGDWKTSDIDMFLYGVTKEEANRIVRHIFLALALDNEIWVILRSRGVINIHNKETKLQIVLRLYDSPTEILMGFDVDCCCCCYDGRDVKVTRRCLLALVSGVNVLNAIHAWPQKPSYELRLAKYALRGFAVYVPGLPKNRIGYNERIQKSKLKYLKGIARFLKVAMEMNSNRSQVNGSAGLICPRYIQTLREGVIDNMSADELLVDGLASYYDEDLNTDNEIIVPSIYGYSGDDPHQWQWWHNEFSRASETRDTAIETIMNCTDEDISENIPRRLDDAWETNKRSREYLNDQMDKIDVDTVYYGSAYDANDEDKIKQAKK